MVLGGITVQIFEAYCPRSGFHPEMRSIFISQTTSAE